MLGIMKFNSYYWCYSCLQQGGRIAGTMKYHMQQNELVECTDKQMLRDMEISQNNGSSVHGVKTVSTLINLRQFSIVCSICTRLYALCPARSRMPVLEFMAGRNRSEILHSVSLKNVKPTVARISTSKRRQMNAQITEAKEVVESLGVGKLDPFFFFLQSSSA